jgi:superfamily II DNA or RNA helicase
MTTFNKKKRSGLLPGQGKTLKEEKKIRNDMCMRTFGTEAEYNPKIDVYKHHNAREFNKQRPFKLRDCVKTEVKAEPDELKRYYKGIRNRYQCAKVDGKWAVRSINRDNKIDDGVCWVRAEDAKCSAFYDDKHIIKSRASGKKLRLTSSEYVAAKRCNSDKLCEWSPKLGECVSHEAMDYISERTIPELPLTWPKDITQEGFQQYMSLYYQNALDQIPQRSMDVFGKGNRCIIDEKLSISQPQTAVNMIFKGMSSNKITTNRGLLIWHGTGSGKTCTATGVMEAYWDNPAKNIVFVSSVEALASNPPESFMKCAMNFFPRFKIAIENAKDDVEKLELVKKMFEQRGVKFFTFAQLAHYLMIANPLKVKASEVEAHKSLLKNAILIIDEVHNIFRPLPHQRHEHTALKNFLADYNNKYTTDLQIAILTATPGDTPEEVVELLNMIRDRKSDPIKVPASLKADKVLYQFAKSVKGLISYFDISSDMSKYPKIVRNGPYIAPMSIGQYTKYVEALAALTPLEKNYEALQKQDKADKYYKPARRYSNMLFNMEHNMSLYEFSSKLPLLIENIKKYPNEKHYVYSTFFENRGFGGHGILAIAKILEKELGYNKLDFKAARSHNEAKTLPSSHKLRYMLAITNELDDKKYTIGQNLQQLVSLFNNPENAHGEYVHVFLASQKFNEGVDFKGVRHIHILEPFLTYNKELQTVGRGARYCSHRDLDIAKDEWTVTVHKYIADFPVETRHINSTPLKSLVGDLKDEVIINQKQLENLKGKRGTEYTKERNRLKNAILENKSKLANIAKEIKHMDQIDPSKYVMVDQMIEKEVKEKMEDMTLLLTAMKESAVDCKLFSKFHGQSGNNYTCFDF